jgi:hypothetical protein
MTKTIYCVYECFDDGLDGVSSFCLPRYFYEKEQSAKQSASKLNDSVAARYLLLSHETVVFIVFPVTLYCD